MKNTHKLWIVFSVALFSLTLLLPSGFCAGLNFEEEFTVLKVELDVAKPTLTLLEENDIRAIITPDGLNATNYKFEIRRTSSSTWYIISESAESTYKDKAKVAGTFLLRVTATIDEVEHVSGVKYLEVQFPSYSDIVENSDIQTATDAAWESTKNATTATTRREEGFWIRLNTGDGKYESTTTIIGPTVGNDDGAYISLGSRPADSPTNPTPLDTPTYTVASFHTHTPTTYRSVGRYVGPSDADIATDISDDVTGVVYDYVAVSNDSIPAGHPINSDAQRYQSGPTKRSTP